MSSNPEAFPFDDRFLRATLAYLWRDHAALSKHHKYLKPIWFSESAVSSGLCQMLLGYFEKHGRKTPSEEVFRELIRAAYSGDKEDSVRKREAHLTRLEDLKSYDISDADFFDTKIREFAKWSAIREVTSEVVGNLQSATYDPSIPDKFRSALTVGDDVFDIGHRYVAETAHRTFEYAMDPVPRIPTGLSHLDELMGGGLAKGELGILLALPKGFKCHTPDTKVMTYDGSTKKIKDVRVGDLLMGDDSTPRRVLQTGSGYGPMYKVSQSNGDDYTVTADHVLCLQRLEHTVPSHSRYYCEQIREVTAEDYSKQAAGFQRHWKGYKVGVDFPEQEVPLDPYFVGLWLGDGSVRSASVTVGDTDVETIEYLQAFAKKNKMRLRREERKGAKCSTYYLTQGGRWKKNPILNALRSIGLSSPHKKHIPSLYKLNSREVRLSLLAGLIDSDGHYNKRKGFIFSNSTKQLCDDTCWLARSLGLKAYVRKHNYTMNGVVGESFRTFIQGKISEVPVRLPRKKAPDSPKASLRTTTKVTPVGDGEWFGVSLDGNQRYLLADFTVTHNSGTMLNFSYQAVSFRGGQNVLYITLELSEKLVGLRFDLRVSNLPKSMLFTNYDEFVETLEKRIRYNIDDRELIIKYFPTKTCSPGMIRSYLDRVKEEMGISFDMVIVDYMDLLKSDRPRKDRPDIEATDICEDLRQIAVDYNVAVWSACRATRDAVGTPKPDMRHMSKSFERVGVADIIFALCQTRSEKAEGKMRIVPVAARNDSSDKMVLCDVQYDRMKLISTGIADIELEEEEERSSDKPKWEGGGGRKKSTSGSGEDQGFAQVRAKKN